MTLDGPRRRESGHIRRGRILVVDDQPAFRRLLVRVLTDDGYEVRDARHGRAALELARKAPFDVVLSDIRMPVMDGRALLTALKKEMPATVVLLITAHGSVPDAVDAMKQGAFDYLSKPLDDPEQLRMVVARAMSHRREQSDEPAAEDGPLLLHASDAMAAVVRTVERVARTDATVLVTGESGTGKEVVARLLHARSGRADGPFVALNCGALAEGLLESELFGHERGAFTGAESQRRGRFELADGGTLLLDEVGEMSAALQVRVLRVLQERTFERVGGVKTLDTDVRIVAATHRDLRVAVEQGRFREDLYYRLAVVPVHVPPLRARGDDVLLLARHFLSEAARRHVLPPLSLSTGAGDALRRAPWPGNVRELHNVIERAAILSSGDAVGAEDLLLAPAGGAPRALPLNLKELERQAIVQALERVAGNRKQAAELLGISLRTLHYKLTDYGLR